MSLGEEFAAGLDTVLTDALPMDEQLDRATRDELPGPELRKALAELGFFAIALDEAAGGFDLSPQDLAPIFFIAGHHLLPVVLREEAISLAPGLAAASDNDAGAAELLAALIDGSAAGGALLQFQPVTGGEGPDLDLDNAAAVLAPHASKVVVPTGDGVAIVDVSAFAATPATGVELGQGLVRLTGSAAAAQMWRVPDGSGLRMLAAAAELVGCASRALDLSVEHASHREQFGRPLTAFQAVAHMLADMKARVELSRSTVSRLAELLDSGTAGDFPFVALHSIASMSRRVCELAIQVHGGTGFTWEYGLHLPYRRVLMTQAAMGGAAAAAKRIGRDHIARLEATTP